MKSHRWRADSASADFLSPFLMFDLVLPPPPPPLSLPVSLILFILTQFCCVIWLCC